MGERKVLVKYYPPDFDPNYLKKSTRSVDKQDNVRMMMPFTCKCNICGHYAGIGTKFNMRKETVLDENYLGLRIYRFYFKCTVCKSEMTFKTDPKNHDYVVEHGATRNYDPNRDLQAAEEVLKQQRENDEEGNAMAFLENRTNDSKREIEINDGLEEIRQLNKRNNKISADQMLRQLFLFQADQGLGLPDDEGEDGDEQKKKDADQDLKQELEALEYMKDKQKVKRIREYDNEQEHQESNFILQGNALDNLNEYQQKLQENSQKKKSLLPIKIKKQINEGEKKINIVTQEQKNKDLTQILTDAEKASQKKPNLNQLCQYSDSDE